MPSRFVILHHTTRDGEHWDLMLEQGDVLQTWQLLANPLGGEAYPISARRIGDHRLAYLTYEGPISGDRGNVTRIDEGEYERRLAGGDELAANPRGGDELTFELRGGRIGGTFRLVPAKPDPRLHTDTTVYGAVYQLVRGGLDTHQAG